MTRPDIRSDARRVESAICGGGVAIVQGDVGYGMLAATPDGARRTVSMKHRAAHKRHGMIGNAEFRRGAMTLDEHQHDMVDAITVDFDLPLGVIGPVRKDHPDLTPCVGHAQSRECSGGSEMIQPDGKKELP